MTSWGVVIIVAAMILGLKDNIREGTRYGLICGIVVFVLLYAAFRQHTY
jgi:hypothetical protein